MGLFVCNRCGTVENTALSNFWADYRPYKGVPTALCSQCDPEIGRWHGRFERKFWNGKSEVMNRKQVELDGKVYWVDPNTIKEAEPGRMICRAWKLDPIREVMYFSRLDELARLITASNTADSESQV